MFDELDEQPSGQYMTYHEFSDASQIVITNLVGWPLTPVEHEAFNDFVSPVYENVQDVLTADPALRARIFGQREVSMADIQDLWSRVDFEIVDNDYDFGNDTNSGGAYWNNGDPVVRFSTGHLANADALDNVSGTDRSMRFQSLHDVAHLSVAGRDHHDNSGANYSLADAELIVNDTARSLQELFGDGTYVSNHAPVSQDRTGFSLYSMEIVS